jgi:hypothetical protein
MMPSATGISFSSTTWPRGAKGSGLKSNHKGAGVSALKKRLTDPLVSQLAAQAQGLSKKDRSTLIAMLRAQGAQHKYYEDIQAAFKATQRVDLQFCRPAMDAEIETVCDVLEGDSELLSLDKRHRHAVLCAVLQCAEKVLLNAAQPVNTRSLLRTLCSESWQSLLNEAYPGYSKTLLGQVLCQELLTGRESSPKLE